jgi:hypothetical protein
MEKVLKVIAISTIVLMMYAMLTSCNRYVSVQDAANGKARCGQSLK